MSVLWVLCLTLALLVATTQALSWLPGSGKLGTQTSFRQHIRRRQTKSKGNPEDENNNSNDEDSPVVASEDDAERKRLSRLPWWEDSWSEAFMNSFPMSPLSSTAVAATMANFVDTTTTNNTNTTDADELAHLLAPKADPQASVLHFCFLLHGHRGFSTDLSYLQRVMQHSAEQEKQARYNPDTTKNAQVQQQHDMIVHCASCNEGKTTDGVVNGGERLVQEILQVIRRELQQRTQQQSSHDDSMIQDITISIVGNSLGGIYGRYAIAKLAQQAAVGQGVSHQDVTSAGNDTTTVSTEEKEDNNTKSDSDNVPSVVLLDGKYRLHFNIFCTTATPHLGISKHTYVPLPRSAEIGVARALGETGRDLFRLNDLIKDMATSPNFLDPLRKFRKRVAYANAYATDFPVPATTAAFLSDQSTYPHHFSDVATTSSNQAKSDASSQPNGTQKGDGDNDEDGYIVATLHTRPANTSPQLVPSGSTTDKEAIVDDLVQMSNALDSLGWKKVFIDVRKEIPLGLSLPKSLRNGLTSSLLVSPKRFMRRDSNQSTRSSVSEGTTPPSVGTSDDESSTPTTPQPGRPAAAAEPKNDSDMHRLRQKGVVESRDVASVVSRPEDMRLHFPVAHNLMVALSREGISGRMYKGGRPVMDALAKQLVQDIFDWNFEEEKDAAEKTLALASQQRKMEVNSSSS